jgi:fructose-1,6-bisphosphatase/inositol monophosphatase family enzyme
VARDREVGLVWTATDGELELAVETARRAGALLVSASEGGGSERRRGPYDVVTELDQASEALIMDTLGSAFPPDRRLGEETGLTVPRPASNRTWIVDPLDGTVNFASGLPFWFVSTALAVDHRVVPPSRIGAQSLLPSRADRPRIEQVFVARPTGVGSALTAYEMPLEGRGEWLAAARRLA